MTFFGKLAASSSFICLAFAMGAGPALAADSVQCPPTKPHHHVRHVTHRVRHASKVSTRKGDNIVRIAQQHLANLGYYNGKIDGVMGPGTKAAIKQFQREQGMKADGVLGSKTRSALEAADHPVIIEPAAQQIPPAVVHPYVPDPNPDVHQDYQTPIYSGSRKLFSRYAQLEATETASGGGKLYNVTLNGQEILTVDGQPSVIGISTTYDMGEEDAIVFTTYAPDSVCLYHTHVLAITGSGNQMFDIQNCTRYFDAHADHGSLYIRFPEADDNRAVGATWRLDGMDLQRL